MFPGEEFLTLLSSFLLLLASSIRYQRTREASYAMFTVASISFVIIAAALALLKLEALSLPITPYVGAIYPAFMAAGVLGGNRWRKYVAFTLLMLILMLVGSIYRPLFVGAEVTLHSVSGLIITFLPLVAVASRRAPAVTALMGVGGLLISIGGLALATLVMQKPLLPLETVLFLLHPLLFLSALLMSAGIYLRRA
ncbi:MAG: hypothetical protein BA066_07260 [Candidatus Korarchaeota archaeon NZ13-K]|nr:MAG: hypothetical protein BA066_07260 [Candidatus Korarchaeota archaeon NZ13-K]